MGRGTYAINVRHQPRAQGGVEGVDYSGFNTLCSVTGVMTGVRGWIMRNIAEFAKFGV